MQHFNTAQLYLRFIIGVTLTLHNIYKMQHLEAVSGIYPNTALISSMAWFYLVILIQMICSVMMMIGLYVRLAAAILTFGTLFMMAILFPAIGVGEVELYALYTFLFIYVWITGGGNYTIDRILS